MSYLTKLALFLLACVALFTGGCSVMFIYIVIDEGGFYDWTRGFIPYLAADLSIMTACVIAFVIILRRARRAGKDS